MNLAVVPELRRRGTAQALLQALQERLAARGIGSLTLEVRASNLPAQRLYTAAGFACIGRRPNYYLCLLYTSRMEGKESAPDVGSRTSLSDCSFFHFLLPPENQIADRLDRNTA